MVTGRVMSLLCQSLLFVLIFRSRFFGYRQICCTKGESIFRHESFMFLKLLCVY